ncbi:rhodanese-like domain-containing protein [Listeria fleischmannii]|uniref:Rhodanese-like domain-containing protein n=1 Tax=Listeria fleischmannii FSL S10-1203 TaxID=1265822 RepID=W7DW54_9LIST|nr:rhodanese-like domain-containing protein [Listeria fleischmannii FSL S10-1203]
MYASISTRELDEKRKSYDIIDVRDREAFLERHIDGAENIPIEELEEHLDHLSKEKKLCCHLLFWKTVYVGK